MQKVIGVAMVILLLAVGCEAPGSYSENSETPTVPTEFINPSADTLYVRVFDEEGWIVNEAVAPFSGKIIEVEEGLYSVAAFNTAGEMQDFYPRGMKAEELKDTVNFGLTIDPEDGSKSVRYRFRNRLFRNMFEARHAFDLTFNEKNVYAVADIRWMYGVESEKSMREDFLKVTQNGKNFVLANPTGKQYMVFPSKCAGPFDPIPDEMTVYYNNKATFPKVFALPDTVERKDAANYLVQKLILD